MDIEVRSVEALFAGFCRTREPACLGEVFDACADDLFAVALHLARDRAAAEDLVQATFLVAIERAHRWDAARPLRPWLLGILHREARQLRRRARRSVDPERLAPPPEPLPSQRVHAADTRRVVEGALGSVPQPYRDVLELHLVHALAPAAIAERLQRSPGAVRTQLWRGLDLLRRLLPPGLAVALGTELLANAPLAAVRARVLDAAATKAVTTAGGAGAVLLGGMLMKKVLLAAAVLVSALVAWSLRTDAAPLSPDAGPAANAPAAGVAAANAAPGGGSAPDAADARTAVQPEVPAPVPAAATAAARAPVVLPVVVVDADGREVGDARVTVFACEQRERNGKREPTGRRAGGPPTALRTDGAGRSRILVDGDCLVAAEHERRGWSGDTWLRPDSRRLPAELRLVLRATATVRGRVLAADGSPAASITVRCRQQLDWLGITDDVPGVTIDGDGRFEARVLAGQDGSVQAQHAGRWLQGTFPALAAGATHELVLRVPGAFSIRGVLADADGAPLRGKVSIACVPDPRSPQPGSVDTDAEGRFEKLLTQGGSYVLFGGAPGRTPARAEVLLDEARPHASVTLRTSPFVRVTARIVDERGEPLVGSPASVNFGFPADEELATRIGAPWLTSMRGGLHGEFRAVASDANGGVRFEVPAGTRCQIWVQVIAGERELFARSAEFPAPADGVVVVVRDADRQGFVVHGRVVAARDEAPIAGARIERVTVEGAGSSGDVVGQTAADGTFRAGPLRVGARYRFTFEAEGFAKTTVGPFDSTVRDEELTVRMPRCGSVRLRVLRADGTPVAGAFASLEAPVHDLFGRAWQGDTDASGAITFDDVLPGPWKVHAAAARPMLRGSQRTTVVETVVHSEQTSSVQIVLGK